MYRIVTHPGSAHKDDFLATSILLATLGEAEVLRREPSQRDLDDPRTYVVDVGFEYDPERLNFDHHQDRNLPCAFHLIMQHLGHHDAAMQMFAWYSHMSMLDVRGPYQTAEHLGVDTDVLFAASSPIEGYVLALFSAVETLHSEDSLYQLMKEFGTDMIAMIEQKMTRLDRLKNEAQLVEIQHLKAIYCEIPENPKLSMELFLKFLDEPRIAMSITPSNRGSGWELLRIEDNAAVDFRMLDGHEQVRFIHHNGFLAKTHTLMPKEAVVALACQAVVSADTSLLKKISQSV